MRYYFPDPNTGGPANAEFEEGKLPAMIILPGTNFAPEGADDPQGVLTENTSGLAVNLARQCYVTMVLLFRGQGPRDEVDTEFTFMGAPELADLGTLIDNMKSAPVGPNPNDPLDLVYDAAIGIGGFSQGSSATWMATGEQDDRSQFRMGMPHDGFVVSEQWLLPNECINGHFTQFFAPGAYRTPDATPLNAQTPTWTPAPGISWDASAFPTLQSAYVSNHPAIIADLQAAVQTREGPANELATSTPGTPYPHMLDQVSPFDGFQPGNAIVEAHQTLAPTSAAGSYPYHSLFIGPGAAGHSDNIWRDYPTPIYGPLRTEAREGWTLHYLTPAYSSSPTPVGNTPTPINTPAPFGYVVDSYHSTPASTPVVTFDAFTSSVWPPAGATPITLYLGAGGTALPVTPSSRFPDFTNEDGWRIWTTTASFACSGGSGEVTCPEETLLEDDGLNQSFVFTATDSLGGLDTVTISGINIDQTPPQLTTTLPDSQTFCSDATTQLNFTASDALSGLAETTGASFNGQPVSNGGTVSLVAGANVLRVGAEDVAGNSIINEDTVQVNYNTSLEFPPNGQSVNPLLPLSFAFKVNDACLAQGWYGGVSATLWLISPSGQEQAAEWYGISTGNGFSLNTLTGWYNFNADLTGLAPGTWTARADLDDGTSRSVTFVIPAAGPNGQDSVTLPTFDCAADLAQRGRFLGGCR